jgi:HK97 family phage major capsid protein
MFITEKQALAVRKRALPTLRKLGVKEATEYAPHDKSWSDLNDAAKELMRACRSLQDSVRDDLSETEVRQLEEAHDGLIAIYDEIDRERNIRNDLGSREARQSDQRPNRPGLPDGTAFAADTGAAPYVARSGWSERDGQEIRVLAPNEKFATRQYNGIGLGSYLRAMVTGPRNEAEKRALQEGTDSAGGYTVPAPLAAEFIDKLRAASVIMRAGARTVAMTSDSLTLARLESDPTVSWRAESEEITASDPTFGRVQLAARSLAGLTWVSRELLEDSANIAAVLENAFTQAIALEFDRAALYGSGVAPEPTGVANISGVNEVSMGVNGAALTGYDQISDAVYELELDNAKAPTGMIFHPRTGNAIRKLKDGNGVPLQWPTDLGSIPRLPTTSIPINETQGSASNASSILIGHWPELLVGLRSSLRIEILKERRAEFMEYGFIAHMRGDVQVAHKASFCRLKGIIP